MGRRGYMNMIALGRSPYEAPESPPEGYVLAQNPIASVNADGYVQQYDDRGHPTNPESKALTKSLRRAKNDILSTMGIVVGGEDGKAGNTGESKYSELLDVENTYGVFLSTIDQLVIFAPPWWATSLASRMQTFTCYDKLSLRQMMRHERARHGQFFYYSGMAAWSCSFALSICRDHLLGPALKHLRVRLSESFQNKHMKSLVRGSFATAKFCIKLALFGITGQLYMFSFLQILRLVPEVSAPSLRSLLPFGQFSLVQLPQIPSITSAKEIAQFSLSLVFSPFILVYMIVQLRPEIESRIYQFLRRRFPKPDRPDRLSVHVASERALIEWALPSLGKRSREEAIRSQLSLTEDLLFELSSFWKWVMRFTNRTFGNKRKSSRSERPPGGNETAESLHRRVEQLRRDSPLEHNRPVPTRTRQRQGTDNLNPLRLNLEDDPPQILTGEDQRFAESPTQIREEYFPDILNGNDEVPEDSAGSHPIHAPEPHQSPHSRANTLFSRPSSPDLSPLSSPRVRASLIHQNSDIVTMQLELLQTSQSQNAGGTINEDASNTADGEQGRSITQSVAIQGQIETPHNGLDRAASGFFDVLLSNHAHNRSATMAPQFQEESDADTPHPIVPSDDAEIEQFSTPVATQTSSPRISFEPLEESLTESGPRFDDDENHQQPPFGPQRRRTATITNMDLKSVPDHRVTVLSTYAVDSLASHLSVVLANILLYPLESLALRGLARSFLTSHAPLGIHSYSSSPTDLIGGLGLRLGISGVRPLDSWFGGGNLAERAKYVGKLALLTGLETIFSTALWGIGTAVAVGLGRRKFGWGSM